MANLNSFKIIYYNYIYIYYNISNREIDQNKIELYIYYSSNILDSIGIYFYLHLILIKNVLYQI